MQTNYTYHIDLDERGEFRADVRNSKGKTVFEINLDDPANGNIFEDGWMKHIHDTDGLRAYLVDLGIMHAGYNLIDCG